MKNTNNSTQYNLKLPTTAKRFQNMIEKALGEPFDLVTKKIETAHKNAIVVYFDSLANVDLIDRDVIRPLLDRDFDGKVDSALNVAFKEYEELPSVLNRILDANVALYYEGSKEIYVIDLKQWDKRSVDTPDAEIEQRGPKESFTESIQTNIALIRRKLKTTNLKLKTIIIGRQSATNVTVAYLDDIVNKKVLHELLERLSKIDIDALYETSQLEQYIEEKPYCLISRMGLTQKPDVAAGRMLQGRVVILVDGTPHVLTVPELFVETIQSGTDYYQRTVYSNYLRLIRLFAFFIAILLPGLAIAIFNYSSEVVPFVFLTSFIKATEGTPLPFALEILFITIMFELLKEAGLRIPKAMGSTITFVGALIIGQAAVDAGIVSAPTIIVVALTAVASLVLPNVNEMITMYRYIFLALGAIMGIIGIVSGLILMLSSIIAKDSFGIPILSSFSNSEQKDAIFRAPLREIFLRPISVVKNNIRKNNFADSNQSDYTEEN